ncbi:MAG: hypothetical protein LBE08_02570 [Bifidobacteriaceae bacterium]|jgi:DNA-binding response OmpR family regulator|nr:hypothetical protein [Bifidobacteriaceae bacterium]
MTVSAPTAQLAAPAGRVSAARILLYSDNALVRDLVRGTIGETIGADARPLVWTQVATSAIAMHECHTGRFDLVVIDNETTKLGGVGLVRQMRAELGWQPVVLLLLARPQDAWLAAWSGADAALLQPVAPPVLVAEVAKLLGVPEV